jgi:hypothetical protein
MISQTSTPRPSSTAGLHLGAERAPAGGHRGRRGLTSRLGAGATAALGTLSGIAPHALHHVGPIAGAALVAGAGGTVLFGVLGLLLSVPFLLRLRRRHGSWRRPVVALLIFATMFTVSTTVIGPAIRGGDDASPPASVRSAPDHAGHHP